MNNDDKFITALIFILLFLVGMYTGLIMKRNNIESDCIYQKMTEIKGHNFKCELMEKTNEHI